MGSNVGFRFGLFCAALLAVIGCSASDNSNAGNFRSPTGGVVAGTGAGVSGTGVISASNAGGPGFGNSTVTPTIIGDPTMAMTKCKSPIVEFVVDGSGSMCSMYGSGSRWQAIRTALIDKTQGLIYMLQDRGQFGLFIYDGAIDTSVMSTMQGPMDTCISPNTFSRINSMTCLGMTDLAPAKNNAAAIDRMFPRTELGGSTPTDKAMNAVIDKMIAAQVPPWDPMTNPQYIILSTDGAPNDICMGGMGGDGTAQQAAVIAAATRAAQAGITTFVISLAGGDAGLEAHLQMVAVAGDPLNPMAHSFSPMNPVDLVTTLKQLLGAAFGCSIG